MSTANPQPQLVDGVDVDAVAAAVRGCPGVDDLDAGAAGSATSYLPGRRIIGVRVGTREVTIQVRSVWAMPAPELARQVRAALASLVGGRRIDVVVADMADPPTNSAATGPPPDPGPVRRAQAVPDAGAAGRMGSWTATSSGPAPAGPSSALTTPTAVEIPTSS